MCMYICAWFALLLYGLFICHSELKGIIINTKRDSFSFRGGGVSATTLREYLSPAYWVQSARRFEYKISSIISIYPEIRTTMNIDKNGLRSQNKFYYLCVAGTFGSAKIRVDNELKLLELMSIFTNLLDMGKPILRR